MLWSFAYIIQMINEGNVKSSMKKRKTGLKDETTEHPEENSENSKSRIVDQL